MSENSQELLEKCITLRLWYTALQIIKFDLNNECFSKYSIDFAEKIYKIISTENFLLDKCHEMRKLLHPGPGGCVNPEIDHALIIKMIRTLLVAIKVKCAKLGLGTGLSHCDRFLSQIDLISTLVQSGCLAFIPTEDNLDEHALRKLAVLLTEKEFWTLALDVSTKAGLGTQGTWSAWGKACLKAGDFQRARKKFSHCLVKVCKEGTNLWPLTSDLKSFDSLNKNSNVITASSTRNNVRNPQITKKPLMRNRPGKDPLLLKEILQIFENLHESDNQKLQETTVEANKCDPSPQVSNNIYYRESLYYLLSYGSSNSILEFYLKHGEYEKCLSFTIDNNIDPDIFFNFYLNCLKLANADILLNAMKEKDNTLLMWKKYLVYMCYALEKRSDLNTLYYIQLFMKDYIRAAMTCIRFYVNSSVTYCDLYSKSQYLIDAQKHLESNLNNVGDFTKKQPNKQISCDQTESGSSTLTLKLEIPDIDKHINTILMQLEITKFLGNAEKEGRSADKYLKRLSHIDTETANADELPTLFGNQQQKTSLAVLAILCGKNPEEGFGICFRIIQDYNLQSLKVYSLAGEIFAFEKKMNFIEQLIKCCRSSGASDSQLVSDCVLTHCISLLLKNFEDETNTEFKHHFDSLIRLINDIEMKINSYIACKQLKTAYLLAVKHRRVQDIKKILKESERLRQTAVQSICTKWLEMNSLRK